MFKRPLSGVHTAHDIVRHRTSDVVRCRPMLSGVAVIEHIDLTAVFTYRTTSYDIATPARHGSLHVEVVR